MADVLDPYRRYGTESQVWSNDCDVKRVGIVLFNGFALPDAAAIAEIFQSANALGETTRSYFVRYDVRLLSAAGGTTSSSSSTFIWTARIDDSIEANNFHALFIGGGAGVNSVLRDESLINWLRRTSQYTKLIFPIAEGRLLVDVAGLGHAAGEPRRRHRSPNVSSNDAGYRQTSEVITPLQGALAVVENDLGVAVARRITGGGEPQLAAQVTAIAGANGEAEVSEKIRRSAQWLEMNSSRSISIDEASKVAAMSERNFLRRFKTEMGVTPSDYLLSVRLGMCCRLLVETDLPVDKVARRCGIGSGGRLSKIFRKYLATTATEYRSIKRQEMVSV